MKHVRHIAQQLCISVKCEYLLIKIHSMYTDVYNNTYIRIIIQMCMLILKLHLFVYDNTSYMFKSILKMCIIILIYVLLFLCLCKLCMLSYTL